MSHTAIMLQRYIDATYLPTSNKNQSNATITLHIIAKYALEMNIPLKCHIYATYAS